jgi:hypothetical protein
VSARPDLIERLAAELVPARRLRSPRVLALVWLVGAWSASLAAAWMVQPLRPGFAEQLLGVPRFAGETLFGFVAGAAALWVGFGFGVPGWGPVRRLTRLVVSGLLAWVAFYAVGLWSPALVPSTLGGRALCFAEVLLHGLPLLVVGLLLLRRLAPLERARSGALVGAAAGAVPGLLMQLACMYVPEHILVFHIAPIVPLVLIGAALGPRLLRPI